MDREGIYQECVRKLQGRRGLLLESATGTGKSRTSILLVNHILEAGQYKGMKEINILLLVAKTTHKITWEEEIAKWGGYKHPTAKVNVRMECYESLHKCLDRKYEIVVADEVHHIGSEARMGYAMRLQLDYFLGLSATIPYKTAQNLKAFFGTATVKCDVVDAIKDNILPEPEIVLFPMELDNREYTETWEMNPKGTEPVVYDSYVNNWRYKKSRQHVILSCTKKQKSIEYSNLIQREKNIVMRSGNKGMEQKWLFHSGQRLEYYSDIKIPVIKRILEKLKDERTVTFCKTIEQCEKVCRHCIHSKNAEHDDVYRQFNNREIDHIAAVNILNENANLTDCKYGIFVNLSSSSVIMPQRQGRMLRHKKPVIIVPYWKDTREQEIVEKAFEKYDRRFIRVIDSIEEL